MTATSAAIEQRPYPRPARGWAIVLILVAAYALAFVDRQIMSLLVDDLRRDLAISDGQIGLLQGPAFGLFYALLGMPFGWLADRVTRVRLIAAGLLLWTAMTIFCGLAESFPMLFLARMGVGVGEAALVPAAVSLLADSFAPQRRALPLAIFTAGVSVGAGLALVLGGALVAYSRGGVADLPLVGGWLAARESWQTVLILAGTAGIPLGLIILCLPEPARRARSAGQGGADALLPWLRRERRLLVPLLAGSSLLYLFSNAFAAWMPSLFIRAFGWQPAAVGLRLGVLILLCALAGNLASGAIATRLVRRGEAGGPLRTMILGAFVLLPAAVLGPLAPGPLLAQVAVMAIYFGIALCFGVATAMFVAVTPGALRGRMVALYLLLGNLIGLGLGPSSVGFVLDALLHDSARVGEALALIGCVSVVPGVWLLRRPLALYAARAAAVRD